MKLIYFNIATIFTHSSRILFHEENLPDVIHTFDKLALNITSDLVNPKFTLLFTTCDSKELIPARFQDNFHKIGWVTERKDTEPLFKIVVFDSNSEEFVLSSRSYKVRGMIKYDKELRYRETIKKGDSIDVFYRGLVPNRKYQLELYKYDNIENPILKTLPVYYNQTSKLVITEDIDTGICYFIRTFDIADDRIYSHTHCLVGNFKYSVSSASFSDLINPKISIKLNDPTQQVMNVWLIEANGTRPFSQANERTIVNRNEMIVDYDAVLNRNQTYKFILSHKNNVEEVPRYEVEARIKKRLHKEGFYFCINKSKQKWIYFNPN